MKKYNQDMLELHLGTLQTLAVLEHLAQRNVEHCTGSLESLSSNDTNHQRYVEFLAGAQQDLEFVGQDIADIKLKIMELSNSDSKTEVEAAGK